MNTLIITHVNDSDPPSFRVLRMSEGKLSESAIITPPLGYPVEGGGETDLMAELRWYLEHFLDYPFHPSTDRADRVQKALKQWGEQAFRALFDNLQTGGWYQNAVVRSLADLQLKVSSDDPRILAWPWEALHDPQRGNLALQCHIERKLNLQADPLPLPEGLPKERINILLIVARPYEHDVQYRSIARPLVELIDDKNLPAQVTVLRPPTFAALRAHLRERSDHYHIVHFDGHGAYGAVAGSAHGDPYKLGSTKRGRLVFETEDGKADPVDAEKLSELLREYRVPAAVLNACQSGMVDGAAEDAFASVATALIKAGARSVVAMAYSLYVSAAQEFLPAFYDRLFEAGDLAEANRAGRQKMFEADGRVCARGKHPLRDWIVPVAYQQEPMSFAFARQAGEPEAGADKPVLPEEAQDTENPYGFVGRDGAILELERAMRRPPAGILVHGLGGVGKTTFARGFVKWLSQTGGLGRGCLWLTFNDIRSAEFVLNSMGTPLFGKDFITVDSGQKVLVLAETLREHPFVIVWDNFESASGIETAGINPLLSTKDRQLLKRFLQELRGGRTKVLITSRSSEAWLGSENRFKLELGGLAGEERWEFCQSVLQDLGKTVDRDDPEMIALMDTLAGHPLLMRAILPMLEEHTPSAITEAVRGNLATLGPAGDEVQKKVMATLRFVEQTLPEDLRPLLVPLSLHERFASANLLKPMAKQVEPPPTRAQIDAFFAALGTAGLVRNIGPSIYELHPALTGFLRSTQVDSSARDAWSRAFVRLMGLLAEELAPLELHEQRVRFHIHGANFHHALNEAERLGMDENIELLTQALAAFARNSFDFITAENLFTQLGKMRKAKGDNQGEAVALHQLGIIAQRRGAIDTAEELYLKVLEITEETYNGELSAKAYHQLGMLAEWRGELDNAEKRYQMALELDKKNYNEKGIAITYHQLGIVAQKRRNFDSADRRYHKSLEITEKEGIEDGAARTYHQLGALAQEQSNFDRAQYWYCMALTIWNKLGIESYVAATYHQLGRIAEECSDFNTAEKFYFNSLEINERCGDELCAAKTYHQLGRIAQDRGSFEDAEKWYQKSLEIEEKRDNREGAARTFGMMGILAGRRGQYINSGKWFIESILNYTDCNDSYRAQVACANFCVAFRKAPTADRVKLAAMWKAAGLGKLPIDEAAAED